MQAASRTSNFQDNRQKPSNDYSALSSEFGRRRDARSSQEVTSNERRDSAGRVAQISSGLRDLQIGVSRNMNYNQSDMYVHTPINNFESNKASRYFAQNTEPQILSNAKVDETHQVTNGHHFDKNKVNSISPRYMANTTN